MRLFIDVTDTWNTNLRTGVQRVVVESARALVASQAGIPVRFNRTRGEYQVLDQGEVAQLLRPGPHRPASRPHRRGFLHRWGLYRPLAYALDLSRRAVIHPFHRMTSPEDRTAPFPKTGPTVLFTAEVIGDRARFRCIRSLCRRPGFHFVASVHDLIPWTHPGLSLLHDGDYRRYLSLLSQARLLCAVSDTTRGELETWHRKVCPQSPVRITRVYPGVPAPTEPLGAPPRQPRFACVGTIETRKNQHRLLDVLEGLWQEGHDFSFVFAGRRSRTSAAFEARFQTLVGQGHPLTWLNPASEDDLEDLYRNSTATVYISVLEGFGLPVVESIARGTPCIASDRGAVGEVARHFGGCLLVDPEDPDSWGRALLTLTAHPAARSRLIDGIQRHRFRTWDDYAQDLRTEVSRFFSETTL